MRSPKVEVYEDKGGEFRWRLKATNGRIIADGGEGYSSRSKAKRAVNTVLIAFGDWEGFYDSPKKIEGA